MSKKINKRKTKTDLKNLNITNNDLNNPSILYYYIFRTMETANLPLNAILKDEKFDCIEEEKEYYSNYFMFKINFESKIQGKSEGYIDSDEIPLTSYESLADVYMSDSLFSNWKITNNDELKRIGIESLSAAIFYKLWKLSGNIILSPDTDFLTSLPHSIDYESLILSLSKLPYDTFIINNLNTKINPTTEGEIKLTSILPKELYMKIHYNKKYKVLYIRQEHILNAYNKSLTKELLEDSSYSDFTILLNDKNTFEETFKEYHFPIQNEDDMAKYSVMRLLLIIAYIGCINGDIKQVPDKQIRIPTNLKTKVKSKEFIIGETVGAAIRRHNQEQKINAYLEGNGTTKSPHVRRGHFHHYWAGNKDNRHLILKWIDPIFVNCSNDEEKKKLPITNKEVIG